MTQDISHEILIEEATLAAHSIIEQDLVIDAHKLVDGLEKIIFDQNKRLKINPAVAKEYEAVINFLKWVYIFDIDEKDLLNLFSTSMSAILKAEYYDLFEKLRHRFLLIYDLEERDKLKDKIKEILLRNKEKLTNSNIDFKVETKAPTISNWLKYYATQLGLESVDALKFNQFFANDDNVKGLSDLEKKSLKKLFTFFEKLKVSSTMSGGFEERFVAVLPRGGIKIINHGIPEEIDPQILRIYQEVLDESLVENEFIQSNPALVQSSTVYSVSSVETKSIDESLSGISPSPTLTSRPITPRTAELEEILGSYSPSSLEYKAISQEILRLKKAEARKDAKR
jgi:hypothetical protein